MKSSIFPSKFALSFLLFMCPALFASPAYAANDETHQPADWVLKPGTVFTDCTTCPEMVVMPPGTFMMGSSPSETERQTNEGPVHSVTLDKPFALGKFEITRGQYARFVDETGHHSGNGCWAIEAGDYTDSPVRNWRDPNFPQQDNHPAVCLNWLDAQAFVQWLSKKTGKHYRLPSEAEWEYAARGNTTSTRFWGNDPDQACDYANVMDTTGKEQVPNVDWRHNCTDGHAYTAPVGSKKPNAFGLYDMLGNVWEWMEDSYHSNYRGAPTDGSAWIAGGKEPVIRGGSWLNKVHYVRVAERSTDESTDHDNFTGFRVARDLP